MIEKAEREGYWRELAKRAPQAIFAPVAVRPAPAKAPESAPIELEIAGFLLRVPPNFDEATLAWLHGPAD
ncbi:MAG: hypothetical protein BroJett014_30110 [Planctomycetota bacterium]|nr:hypothetical protein [Planctomycetota bacterium]GIK54038.1 MAG: hypothetical protein BroJett014_30110 [Planctomycetota bacterium]